MATTSGTVSTYPFNQRKVIDHAFRRAGRAAQRASAENIQIAQDLIYTITSQWANAGFMLWTRQFLLLPIAIGSADVTCPTGTVEVLNAYWRAFNPWRGGATLSTGGDGSVLFAGAPNDDVAITGINPAVWVNFGSAIETDTIGVLLGGASPVTAALQVQTSADGLNWATVQTLPSTTFSPMTWAYFDLDPVVTVQYLRVMLPSAVSTTWTLNQMNFGLANSTEVDLGILNIDDYWSLPNKYFSGDRVTSCYTDRQLNNPVIKAWPVPNVAAFYNGTVTALTRRYVQDPGSMTNNVEIPQRWAEALIWRLAKLLMFELPDEGEGGGGGGQASYFGLMAKQQRVQFIEAEAAKAEALAWAEERTKAPIRMMPDISAYTS